MLKMYQNQSHAGSSPDFWDETWDSTTYEDGIRFSGVDPLRPLFETYLKPDSLMLEGGCGIGNYISYYTVRGYRVIGLDFAQRALKTLHIRHPGLLLTGGNVSEMPFDDGTFDLYYSGGVVEHFEGGPEKALLEAARVLKKDGTLLISVPYYSPIRRIMTPFRKHKWRVVSDAVKDDNQMGDKQFFQYAYSRSEFSKMLDDAGLRVIKTQGYAVLWGLYELPFRDSEGGGEFARTSVTKKEVAEVDLAPLVKEQSVSLIKRLVVSEDSSVPVLGLGVIFMRWAAANMMMYVCERK